MYDKHCTECLFESEYADMTLNNNIKQFRFQMPDHERRHMWLSLLLDCYAIIDYSVHESISQSDKKVVCHKGCSVCCYQTIPLSTIESIGIKFYVQTIPTEESRLLLDKKINKYNKICLFNAKDSCLIYPLRPIACRRYIITSQCCSLNEDPTITRANDVLEPSREYLHQAIKITLPFYESQNIHLLENEHIFDFYKRQNVKLSSIYDKILNITDSFPTNKF
jgi:hypothetical protein